MFALLGFAWGIMSPSHFLNIILSSRSHPLSKGTHRASLVGSLEWGVFERKEIGVTLYNLLWLGIYTGYHYLPALFFVVAATLGIILAAMS